MTLEGVRTRRLVHGGQTWRLWIQVPGSGEGPWPVIWVLDGADRFSLVSDTVRHLSARPGATGVRPAVVIGLDRDPADRDARHGDAAPWPSDDPDFADGVHRGAENLLNLLTGPALDAVARCAPLDRARQVLIGHSIMAYFTLYALTARPGGFRTFAAVSPSIWWNETRLTAALTRMPDAGQRLFIAVGEREEPTSNLAPGDDRRIRRRMVSRAVAAAELAQSRLGDRAVFHKAQDEDHASVLPAVLPRLLRFAFGGRGRRS